MSPGEQFGFMAMEDGQEPTTEDLEVFYIVAACNCIALEYNVVCEISANVWLLYLIKIIMAPSC